MIFNLYPVILVNSYISCSRPFADSLKFSTVFLLFLVFKFTFYLKIIPKWKLQENMIVNFMSQLTGLRDAQITGKRIFLAMPVRMFLEETNIWFSRWSKKFATLTLWMDIIQSTGGLREQEGKGTINSLSFLELAYPLSALGHQSSGSQAFGLWELHQWPPVRPLHLKTEL